MDVRFLIVDDDPDDRDLFCEAIEAIDRQIVCYAEGNAQKALDKLDKKKIEHPDVIFLDINMPIMDGWQCLSRLKSSEAYKKIPVIMYSTSSQQEDIEKATQLGAVSFFTKPLNFKSLQKNLEIVVKHAKDGSLQAAHPGSPLFSTPSS